MQSKFRPRISPFEKTVPCVEGNPRLREPQVQAFQALEEHFAESDEPALVQLPVGCGKSGLMSILPFGLSRGRSLLVAPNVTIRDGLFESVDPASPRCFWRAAAVAPLTVEGPFAAKLDGPDASLDDCNRSHYVVANIQQLAHRKGRWLKTLPRDFFDLVLIDEGHHNPAASWKRVTGYFGQARAVSLTATPFRSDGQEVIGKLVYRYPLLRAIQRGYVKSLRSMRVEPGEVYFTFRDESRRVSLDEVLRLRETTWFSRGVALAPECNRHIVRASIAAWRQAASLSSGKPQIIAAACSVEHARQVAQLYRDEGVRALEVHSAQTDRQRDSALAALRSGKLDAIVQVEVLGEGFDHPPLSVAAVFRPYRSLAPYLQFVGRTMRSVIQGRPGVPENVATIVTHVGLDADRHWKDLRLLDDDEAAMWRQVLTSPPSVIRSKRRAVPRQLQLDDSLESEEPPSPTRAMHVASESGHRVVSLEIEPLSEADRAPEQLLTLEPVQSSLAGPLQRRREARSRLQQEAHLRIGQILFEHRLPATGRQVARAMRGMPRVNNWQALRVWLYRDLNAAIGRRRGRSSAWTLEESERAVDLLPRVSSDISRRLQLVTGRGLR